MLGWRAALVLSTLAFLDQGCGSSDVPEDEGITSPWPAFTRLSPLGARCTASLANAPGHEYGALTFIPCASGQPGCGELVWDGVVSSPLLTYDYSVAFDAAGSVSRLLATRHGTGTDERALSTLEAVAFDVPSGAPLLALRNRGDEVDLNSAHIGTKSEDCVLVLAISDGRVGWLAAPSGKTQVSVAQSDYAPGSSLELRPTSADLSAMGRMRASDSVLAANQSDGMIHRFRFDGSPDVYSYGPDVKVSLSAVVGDDVFVQDQQFHSYQLGDDGQFVQASSEMSNFHAAGGWAAWIAPSTTTGYEAWVAPYSSDLAALDSSKQKIADVADPRGLAFGDGWLAVGDAGPPLSASPFVVTAYELQTGATRSVTIPVQDYAWPQLIAVVGDHVWVAVPDVFNGYTSLQRYALSAN